MFFFCLSIAFLCTFLFAIKAMLRKRTVLKCSDDNTTVVLCLIKRCWLRPEDTFIYDLSLQCILPVWFRRIRAHFEALC